MPQLSPQALRLPAGRVSESSGYTDSSSFLSLNFCDGTFKEEKERGKALVESSPPTRSKVPISVLIVDDDDEVRVALIDSLLELTGAEIKITEASSGNETLQLIEDGSNKFDWILLDLIMPGINGFETATTIWKVNKVVRIILMTSDPNSSIARAAQAKGHRVFNKLDLDLNTLLFPQPGETSS